MSKKKKILILSCMMILLVATAVVNYIFTTKAAKDNAVDVAASANYFTQYRTRRSSSRNEELLQIEDILSSESATQEEKSEATKLKLSLTEITEKEMLLESLIKAYGFEDVVVIISLTSENVNVVAKTNEMTAEDSIKIYTIIEEEGIASPENVKIIPIV